MKTVSALTFAVQSFVTLLVIFDPPGATPIFLALVSDKSQRERTRRNDVGGIVQVGIGPVFEAVIDVQV